MHNTLLSIVVHLVVVNFCYCVLVCKTISFRKCDYRYRDILDN